ncbi:peptide chain release factor 1 [Candidatus Micrarchaeota archaeon]|nr:MAG: peptide chain release factor 1 [Candidatus Micrarchaeota archaeon]
MPESSKEMHQLKKELKYLKSIRGQGTELISVYIPPNANVNEISARLRSEYGQAANIKSKSTRKNVQAAIDRILQVLKGVHKTGDKGVAIFCGNVSSRNDQPDIKLITLIPPKPINVQIYRCDSSFYTKPLEDMLGAKEIYGAFAMDRREATIALIEGKHLNIIRHMTSNVPGKHHKGGQSAMRFTRLIEEAAVDFYKKVAEVINEAFSDPKVKAIIAGGSGPTKYGFIDGPYLRPEVKKKIVGVVDTGYTDEFGIKEILDKSGEIIEEMETAKEKKLVDRFIKEASVGNLAAYGEKEVREALERGQVELLMLSEGLDDEKIDELESIAEEMGTKVEIISTSTNGGQQFLKGFGGIGAILRYRN